MRLTPAMLAACLLLAACGGSDASGGPGPAPTAVLKVAATGLPAGYTAPYTLLKDGAPVATDALSAGDSLLYAGLAYGTYVVKWGNRITRTGGDTFTWAATADTVILAAADVVYLATGEYAAITGGLILAPSGPPGTGVWYALQPQAGGFPVNALAQVDLPARVSNLAPGAYLLVPRAQTNVVNGLSREVGADTLQVLVTVGPALDTIRPVFRPLDAMLEAVVLGLPTGLRAGWGITDTGGSWSVGGSAPTGTTFLRVVSEGTATALWGDVFVGDTTYIPAYDSGPFPVAFGFPILRSDTIRYAPH